MALPPERVNIKRKRDAEAVDVLFLQDKKRPRFIFQKVDRSKSTNIFARTNPFLPGSGSTKSKPAAPAPRSVPSHHDAAKSSGLREFRLNRTLGAGRVQKSRSTSPKKDLATFLETRQSAKDQADKQKAEKPEPAVLENPLLTPHKQRLRPRASAVELRWREKQWGSASGSRSASRAPAPDANDPEQLRLAEQLNAFALAESRPTVPGSTTDDAEKPKTPLKFQPKPAPPRGRERKQAASDGNIDAKLGIPDDSDSESDYEYDTYIRIPVEGDGMEVDWNMEVPAFAGKSLGVLVIEEEDEELWATYALDDGEDAEFDTDDEDENAEDYYGNDYPEDELESDDEFNRAAYGYRYAGSDDEHFGNESEDEGERSDTEERPSRLIGSHSAAPWANEFASPIQHGGLNPY